MFLFCFVCVWSKVLEFTEIKNIYIYLYTFFFFFFPGWLVFFIRHNISNVYWPLIHIKCKYWNFQQLPIITSQFYWALGERDNCSMFYKQTKLIGIRGMETNLLAPFPCQNIGINQSAADFPLGCKYPSLLHTTSYDLIIRNITNLLEGNSKNFFFSLCFFFFFFVLFLS